MVARGKLPFLVLGSILLLAPAFAGCVTPASTEPSVAKDLLVEQVPNGARLTWDEEPRGAAERFNVYRGDVKVATVKAPLRTYLDRNVTPDVTYRYSVAAVDARGVETVASNEVTFTLARTLGLVQDARASRGYVNFTVLQASPGIRWADLTVVVGNATLALSEDRYILGTGAWRHDAPRDPLADRGERLMVHAPGDVVRNASFEVRLPDGLVLVKDLVQARPTLNLTLRQERNATEGLVSLLVEGIAWRDGVRDVTSSYAELVPRWSALTILVDGTRVPPASDNRAEAWSREVHTDDVVRVGARVNIRSSLIESGAQVVVVDAEATEESFRLTLR